MEYKQQVYQQDFLLLNYQELDFFVSRTQFSGSTSIDKMVKSDNSVPYFDRAFTFNNKTVLLFDCDSFLQDTFHCKAVTSSQLCLLMKIDNFSKDNRPVIHKLLTTNPGFSTEYIGLIIPANAEIAKINLDDIYLPPAGLKNVLAMKGIYGCRFPEKNRVQYYIDFEVNILNTILKG